MDAAPGLDPLIGRRVGNYEIVGRLGAGGGGVVYKALDSKLQRTVALKFLPADRRGEAPRFLQEARAASALDHPNIGVIHGIEEADDGRLFIVMAYYEGETLAARIARGPLPPAQAVEFVTQAADGLAAAHAKGIVHRDIKPANIMVARQGAVKVLDFGLARFADSDTLTRTGSTVGTAVYMSPEQAMGRVVDARSDIWSLGVVLYEAVTGRLPFDRENVPTTLLAIAQDPPAAIEDVPPQIQAVIYRCLAKDPERRYKDIEEFRRDLELIPGRDSSLTRTLAVDIKAASLAASGLRRTAAPAGPWRIVAGVALAALVAAAGWFGYERWRAPATPREKHIVVLPFTNIGGDPANGAICDGLLESLTNRLSTLEGLESSLWVAPSSEVRRRNIADPTAAQRAFGANLVVTGSVQRGAKGVRLALSLVDARTLQQVGSAMLDDRAGDFSSLEDAAVARLAKLLAVELRPGASGGSGENAVPAAYESYLKGVSFLQRYDKPGNLDTAIQQFQEAAGRDPRFALAFAKLGEAEWLKSRATHETALADRALADCNRAAAINDQLAPVYSILGAIYADSGKYDLAIEQFQRALQLNPRDPDAHQKIAKTFEAQGRTADAEASFQKAVALRPDYWDGHNSLGAFYSRHQQYREAAAEFRKVIELTPDNAPAYSNLGAMLNRLGDRAGALAAYEKSIAIAPSYAVYGNLARAYYGAGNYAQAAEAYEKALKFNDRDYRPWVGAAAAYTALGMPAKAKPALERAAQLLEPEVAKSPNNASGVSYLATIYAKLGNRSQATVRIENALALAPTDQDVLYNAALTYEFLRDRATALRWLRAALAHGYPRESVARDPDLAGLRKDAAFPALMK
jgi:tetratricopeptide (TPR) repeat protein/tRNA A-37 threonylcarbamoyl transferase component Bud32